MIQHEYIQIIKNVKCIFQHDFVGNRGNRVGKENLKLMLGMRELKDVAVGVKSKLGQLDRVSILEIVLKSCK